MKRAARFYEKEAKEIKPMYSPGTRAYHFLKKRNNRSVTENGAVGYRTTRRPLLDLNFKVSSLRCMSEQYIVDSFVKAFYEDRKYAVKWLFYLRDVLEGMGERRSFRICLKYLAISQPRIALAVMKLVPEYGRYDDLLAYVDTPLCSQMCKWIKSQLTRDVQAMKRGEKVSLLAKWLPGSNTSSVEARRYAAVLIAGMGMKPRTYRKTLSALRAYLDVVEVKMSAANWERINYDKVPAKANMRYDAAFERNDREGRADYFRKLLRGKGKLNVQGLVPHELVHRIMGETGWKCTLKEDLLTELMWQQMQAEGFQNEWGLEDCIVVADGSGSMFSTVSGSTSVKAIEVCNALAIYFAEQLQGIFHNKAITFSGRPEFIDLEPGRTLKEKLEIMLAHDEVANTNIEAVFDLLLDMAVSNEVPAEELPGQVLIISDMEFDEARTPGYYWDGSKESWQKFDDTLFGIMESKYKAAGYTMPRLIFWNVCGRTKTIPMVQGGNGICLLSGFSQNAMKVAAHRKAKDPYECLLRVLDGERYAPVEKVLKSVA